MLYIAIFSILGGLVLIIIAIISAPSSGRKLSMSGDIGGAGRKKIKTGATFEKRNKESAFPSAREYSRQMSGQDYNSERLELFSDDVDLNLEEFDDVTHEGGAFSPAAGNILEFNSVLFEDSSQVIDYSRETGTIDPTFREYKKIKRVGSGTLNVENDGLNFYMGKKFFRFDFSRVTDMKIGDNYIAVIMQGSSTVKLFLVIDNRKSIKQARSMYEDFLALAS